MLNICRLCLTEAEDPLKNIINSKLKCSDLTLVDCLYWVFGVEVNVCDPYSKLICSQCICVIKYVGNFRETFQRNQILLQEKRDLFKNNTSEASTSLLFNDEDTSHEKNVGTSIKKRNTKCITSSRDNFERNLIVSIPRLEESNIYMEYRKINDTLYKKIKNIDKFKSNKKFISIRSLTSPMRKKSNDKEISTNSVNNEPVRVCVDEYRRFPYPTLIIPKLEDTKFREEFKKVGDITYKQIPRKSEVIKPKTKRFNFIEYYYGVRTSALQELIKEKSGIDDDVKITKRPEAGDNKNEPLYKIGSEYRVEVSNYYGNVFETKQMLNSLYEIEHTQTNKHKTNIIRDRKCRKKSCKMALIPTLRLKQMRQKWFNELLDCNQNKHKQVIKENNAVWDKPNQEIQNSTQDNCLLSTEYREKEVENISQSTAVKIILNSAELPAKSILKSQKEHHDVLRRKINILENIDLRNCTRNPSQQFEEKKNETCGDTAKISNALCNYNQTQDIGSNTNKTGITEGNQKVDTNAKDEIFLYINEEQVSTFRSLSEDLPYVDSTNLETENRDMFEREQSLKVKLNKFKDLFENRRKQARTSLLVSDVDASLTKNVETSLKNHTNCVTLTEDKLETVSQPSIVMPRLEESNIYRSYKKIDGPLYKKMENISKDNGKKFTNLRDLTNPVSKQSNGIEISTNPVDCNLVMLPINEYRNFSSPLLIIPRLEDTKFLEEFEKVDDITYKQIPRKVMHNLDVMEYENKQLNFINGYNIGTSGMQELLEERGEIADYVKIDEHPELVKNKSEPLFQIDCENQVEVCKYCSEVFETKQMINSHYKIKHGESMEHETDIIRGSKRRKKRAYKGARKKVKTRKSLTLNKKKRHITDQTSKRSRSYISSMLLNGIRHKLFNRNKMFKRNQNKRNNFSTSYENFPNLMFIKETKENNLIYNHKPDEDEPNTTQDKILLTIEDKEPEVKNISRPVDSMRQQEEIIHKRHTEHREKLKKKMNLLQNINLGIQASNSSQFFF